MLSNGRKIIPLEIACDLCNKICDFLLDCGGNYQRITPFLQEKILVCLASRQFIIKIRQGEIRYFVCWFKIHKEDIEDISNRILPQDVFNGDVVYLSEIGNKDGKEGMKEIKRRLYKENPQAVEVLWHRPVKEDKVFHFKVRKCNGR